MTLQDCLSEGIENNFEIRLSRMDEEMAANNDSWSAAGGMTTVGINSSYSGSLYNRDTNYSNPESTDSQRDVMDHTLAASLNAEWTLFNGFQIQSSYRKLQELHVQGQTNTRIAIEDIAADISASYYNYVRQLIHRNNLNYAVSLSRERLRIVQERFMIGDNSRLDLQQAQVDFNADSAKSLKQNEAVQSALIALNQLMSRKDLRSHFVTADTMITLLPELDFSSIEQHMIENNLQLMQAESQTRLSELEMKNIASRNYPYLKVNASYAITHNIYGSSSADSRTNWGPNVGATIGINLMDGTKKIKMRNSRLATESAKISRDNLELSLRSDLTDLWQAYQNNLKLVELENQNVLTARENHSIACERYLIGDLSGLEMREAQKSLLDAEESLLQAQYDTKICEISLLQISSQIIEYLYNLEVK